MNIRSSIFGMIAAGCMLGITLPRAVAEVTDEEFNALKDSVRQLGEKVQKLEDTHEQDQQTHALDQQKIQQLEQQLEKTQATAAEAQQKAKSAAQVQEKFHWLEDQVGETRKTAAEAEQKAEAAAQVQPVAPVPSGALATHSFTLAGDAEVQFGKVLGQHSAFTLADFAPVFLFRATDKALFEAGFDVRLTNGAVTLANGQTGNMGVSTGVDLSFAQLDYLLNDYATFVGGWMLLPLGTYTERSAGWLNKIPDDPLPRGILPSNGAGVQLRGAIPIGQCGQSLTYSGYVVNGPGSVDGSGNATFVDSSGSVLPNLDFGNVGTQSNGNSGNLHANPSGGGRIGWFLPLKPHYDFELGVSGQTGPWNDKGNRLWSAGVVDAALHISPYIEVKGEYMYTWQQTNDRGTVQPQGWWIQAAYKLAGLGLTLPFINNFELVGRYDTVLDGLGTRTNRETAGYVYYVTNTLWLEGDYEWLQSHGPNKLPENKWVFQISLGF